MESGRGNSKRLERFVGFVCFVLYEEECMQFLYICGTYIVRMIRGSWVVVMVLRFWNAVLLATLSASAMYCMTICIERVLGNGEFEAKKRGRKSRNM